MRLAVLTLLLLPSAAVAQSERYELGRRLRVFEAAWEKHEAPAARGRALSELPKLTSQFFSLQLGEAGRTLDRAAFALTTDAGPSGARQFVWSLSPVPESRIVDGSAKEIAVTVRQFYPVKADIPKGLELQFWFTDRQVVKVKPEKFPLMVKVPLPPLGEFRELDRKLYFLADSAKELRPVAVGVSQVADLKNRLAALKKAADGWDESKTIEQATVRDRAGFLASLAAGDVPDSDIPAAALLANAEAMLDGKPFFTPPRHGQFWLSVPLGEKRSVACRVFVPKGLAKEKPVPVVVALHGAAAGASAWFEGYGAGQIVKECEERGWLLVAPECGLGLLTPPVGRILETLGARYPLDAKRVLLVGHSMGARLALEQARSGKFAAVAALGGGGRVSKEAFAELPVFVGVGEKDSLALEQARSLRKALADAGAKAVTYKECPGVEHLVVVRESLPEVFAMFDASVKKSDR